MYLTRSFLPLAGRKGASAQSPEGGQGRGDGRGGQTVGSQETTGSGGGQEPRRGASEGQEEVRFGHRRRRRRGGGASRK